jgi:soluble lytic murein transglycosylase-like protein
MISIRYYYGNFFLKVSCCLFVYSTANASGAIYLSTTADGSPYYSQEAVYPNSKPHLIVGAPPPRPKQARLDSLLLRPTLSVPGAYIGLRLTAVNALVAAAANAYKVPEALLLAVMHAESHFNPKAMSPVGAVGLMQIMPLTGKRYGVYQGLSDPATNIDVGARYLKDLLLLFKGDKQLAVAAYNAGEGAVMKYGNRVPPYAETKAYVPKVMALYQNYSTIAKQ